LFIILGATGHVGATVAATLLEVGEQVTVVTRSRSKAKYWESKGANAAVVDVNDRAGLAAVFRSGTRAFLLNPHAPLSTNTDAEEHRTLQSIVAALDGSGLEKVVLESAYGAQKGEKCGDLSVLYDFEQALAKLNIPVMIQRADYYMSNWDQMLKSAREEVLPSMFPPDLVLPMVAPADLGKTAARLLREPPDYSGLAYVEGPQRYTVRNVSQAFAKALGTCVELQVIPREGWIASYRNLGFSEAAAETYARMTNVTVDGPALPANPIRGSITLETYIAQLVAREQPE
jgi:uncharacterized protein YbjT (DUF2867 family)